MLTTCTACGTQFRVSTAQLRAVHGLVRCSLCHSVFDAFETLREEFETAPTAEMPPAESPLTGTAPLSAAPEETPAISATETAPPLDAADLNIEVAPEKTPPTLDDLFTAVWGGPPPPAPPAESPAESAPPAEEEPQLIEDHIAKPPELERDQTLFQHAELPPRERLRPKAPRRPLKISAWSVAAVVLVLLLLMQLINAGRLALSHNPVFGTSLAATYAVLGRPIRPPPNPGNWQVNDINVTSDPDTPGALSITGTLQNSAGFAQPWPLLRVELTDRDDDPLRARDFTATEYLPVSQGTAWLGAGMAARFRIDVVDPGPEAVGFQVQTCVDYSGVRRCGGSGDAASD